MATVQNTKPLSSRTVEAMKPGGKIKADTGENTGLRVKCGVTGLKTFFYRYTSPITSNGPRHLYRKKVVDRVTSKYQYSLVIIPAILPRERGSVGGPYRTRRRSSNDCMSRRPSRTQ
jgi:hypothetical protein